MRYNASHEVFIRNLFELYGLFQKKNPLFPGGRVKVVGFPKGLMQKFQGVMIKLTGNPGGQLQKN